MGVDWEGKNANADGRDLNENARRMAAIANEGLIGQDWLGDMANEAPAAYADLMLKIASGMDAKSAAQSITADFQDGLRPDMVNQDAVKDRVRRMILGEQSTAEMANQIAQELSAELGVSLASAQAAAGSVLGVKPTTDAAGLAEGLSQATNGKALITQIATQMGSGRRTHAHGWQHCRVGVGRRLHGDGRNVGRKPADQHAGGAGDAWRHGGMGGPAKPNGSQIDGI
ncbi:MAG: hypothetical protein IPM07_26305 [Anaerolineales bacterium]|nr:hypothetical protein [Anaerolineales bacterium]